MWMRVTRAQVDPAKLEEATKLAPEVDAAIKRLPGYQSYVSGGDRTTGQSISVTTWDTEEHARWPADALGDLVSKFRALNIEIDPPEVLEVTSS
jgi:hypothetical protein